ncbi:MAG: hypothetical protein M3N37_08815 [Actinomycetota bacterium]|nr:hypothetical protein [Actinomycetota bacterium]MDP8954994.1 hypothetical protein [Actinomycetota bacterium]
MDKVTLGQAGLAGWRKKVGDVVARPVAGHSSLSTDQVQAAVGALFFALSLLYVTGTFRRLLRRR